MMEHDYYGGIVVGIIIVIMIVATFICIGGKYQELSDRAQDYNREILSIMNGE